MPAPGDVIRVRMVQEVGGVAISNALYFVVDDLGNNPGTFTSLSALAIAYWTAISGVLTTQSQLTCVIYDNQTAIEGTVIIFPIGLIGILPPDAHPQSQVVRINLYAQDQPDDVITVGAFNLTGTAEVLSFNGRITDPSLFNPAVVFMEDVLVLGAGWTLTPCIRSTTFKGRHDGGNDSANLIDTTATFVINSLIGKKIVNRTDRSKSVVTSNTATSVDGVLAGGKDNNWDDADIYGISPVTPYFPPIIQSVLNSTYLKLRGRTTKLCGN